MKKDTYTVKYRLKGDTFTRTLKGIWRDEFVYAEEKSTYDPETKTTTTVYGDAIKQAFWDENNEIHYVPLDAYVRFLSDRQEAITKGASKESGQNIQTRFT